MPPLHEISAIITPALITVFLAFLTAIGAWLRMKTKQWEKMTEDAREYAKESRELSQVNHDLLESNIKLSKSIERNSNGLGAELRGIAVEAAFKSGKIKGRLEKSGMLDDKELENLEHEFMESIKPKSLTGTEEGR